jgi:hypothetical protein
MAEQYSPGPWRVAYPEDDGWAGVFDSNDDLVADVVNANDAQLIACTPDLLREVKKTVNLLEHLSPDLPTLPELRALVRRAEGEQSTVEADP